MTDASHYKYVREMKDRQVARDKCPAGGKKRFASSALALDRARKWLADALRGKRPPGMGRWDGRYLRVYQCRACNGWHLTHEELLASTADPRLEVHA